MKRWSVFCACLVALLLSQSATAAITDPTKHEEWFKIGLAGDKDHWNVLSTAQANGGSGWNDGQWIAYEKGINDGNLSPGVDRWGNVQPLTSGGVGPAELVPAWHNQWFYDDPFDPTRWKIVSLDFDYVLLDPAQRGGVNLVLNWTLPGWPSDPTKPPLPGQGDPFIGRVLLDPIWLDPNDPTGISGHYSKTFDLRRFGVNYNPEWVSIDVAGYNILLSGPTPGSFTHECVPEPGALTLLGLGTLGLIRRRRGSR